jgi:hypothetical protein
MAMATRRKPGEAKAEREGLKLRDLVEGYVKSHGGSDRGQGPMYPLIMPTKFGPLAVSTHPGNGHTVFARFEASPPPSFYGVNPHTGKWNLHTDDPPEETFEQWKRMLAPVEPGGAPTLPPGTTKG